MFAKILSKGSQVFNTRITAKSTKAGIRPAVREQNARATPSARTYLKPLEAKNLKYLPLNVSSKYTYISALICGIKLSERRE